MGETVGKIIQQTPRQTGAPLPAQMAQTIATVYGVMMTSGAVLMIIGGSIYPIIMIWVLTRPAVKAACGEFPTRPPESP